MTEILKNHRLMSYLPFLEKVVPHSTTFPYRISLCNIFQSAYHADHVLQILSDILSFLDDDKLPVHLLFEISAAFIDLTQLIMLLWFLILKLSSTNLLVLLQHQPLLISFNATFILCFSRLDIIHWSGSVSVAPSIPTMQKLLAFYGIYTVTSW